MEETRWTSQRNYRVKISFQAKNIHFWPRNSIFQQKVCIFSMEGTFRIAFLIFKCNFTVKNMHFRSQNEIIDCETYFFLVMKCHFCWITYKLLLNKLFFIFSNLETCLKIYLGALIFALIMISLVIMCIISLCVAKAQQGKGAQKYGPHTDVPGKHSRNFVRNVQPYERWVTQTTIFQFFYLHNFSKQVEINFGNEKKKTPVHEFVNEQAFKPNYEFSQPKKSSTPPPKYVSHICEW